VLSTQFLDYTFRLSINWPAAVIFKYFQLEIRGKNWFSVIISYLLYRLHVCLLFYGFKFAPAEQSCVSYRCHACYSKWQMMWWEFEVPRTYQVAVWVLLRESTANETSKQFYFNFWLWLVFITMTELKRRKAFSIQEKMDTPAQVDAKRKHVLHWLPD
jgi:hypothetical protein